MCFKDLLELEVIYRECNDASKDCEHVEHDECAALCRVGVDRVVLPGDWLCLGIGASFLYCT